MHKKPLSLSLCVCVCVCVCVCMHSVHGHCICMWRSILSVPWLLNESKFVIVCHHLHREWISLLRTTHYEDILALYIVLEGPWAPTLVTRLLMLLLICHQQYHWCHHLYITCTECSAHCGWCFKTLTDTRHTHTCAFTSHTYTHTANNLFSYIYAWRTVKHSTWNTTVQFPVEISIVGSSYWLCNFTYLQVVNYFLHCTLCFFQSCNSYWWGRSL